MGLLRLRLAMTMGFIGILRLRLRMTAAHPVTEQHKEAGSLW